jgi:hypothetical protein
MAAAGNPLWLLRPRLRRLAGLYALLGRRLRRWLGPAAHQPGA